jgi:hypothetical protein
VRRGKMLVHTVLGETNTGIYLEDIGLCQKLNYLAQLPNNCRYCGSSEGYSVYEHDDQMYNNAKYNHLCRQFAIAE